MRKALWWSLQLAVAGIVVWFAWSAIVRDWTEFRSMRISLSLQFGWIAASVLAVLLSYVVSVEAWRRVLAGWNQHLAYGRAVQIWLVANLGRYLPGKVWSVAGLMVLAQRAGVAAWAAGASAFAIQAVAIGTAVVLVAAATPGATSPLRLAAAALASVIMIAILSWGRAMRLLAKAAGKGGTPQIEPLPAAAVAWSSALGVIAWMAHGAAFWFLARGLGLQGDLSLITAAGVFPLGYLLGLLALFAPGGVGVREVVLIGLLAPVLGSGPAVALSIASRILLTVTEVVAPLCVLLFTGMGKEEVSVRP